MTTNAIRCHMIERVLKMDRSSLMQLQELANQVRRAALPADLPEWIPASQAADFLHITPRHLRRICAGQLSITYQLREFAGYTCWHLHRDLLRSLAEAPMCAKQAPHNEGKS